MSAQSQPTYPDRLIGVENEAALLGAMMYQNDTIDRVSDIVSSADFYEPCHRLIFEAMLDVTASGKSANPLTLRPYVDGDPMYDPLGGGMHYLVTLSNGSPAAIVGTYDFAKAIADLAKRRRLLDEIRALTADLEYQVENPIESLVDRVDTALSTALSRHQSVSSMTLANAVKHTLQGIEDEANGLTPRRILVDGLHDWNVLTGGVRPGNVVILAGRPSMGKTATAISLALATARAGHGTLFISLEMEIQELTGRAISDLVFQFGNAPTLNSILSNKLNMIDRRRIAEAQDRIADWPFVMTDPPSLKIGRLAMMIRRYQRQMAAKGHALKVVFIDYLGLIQPDKRVNRYEDVSEISRSIKRIAKECGVAIVVLSQLNREVEKREDKRPQLSDLRDSGDIEQDADAVIFVYREQYYLERSEPDHDHKSRGAWEEAMTAARDRVELIAAKVRGGKVGKRNCYFFAAHQAVRGSNYMIEDQAQ